MYLWIGNQETRVQANDDEIAWLTEYLQFEDSSTSFYMSNGRAGFAGTTRRRFYNYGRKTFPAGLTAMVYRDAQKQGFDVHVVDERIKPADLDASIDLEWLKERKLQDGTPYQYSAVLRTMTRTRGLLWLPTGSGKCLAPDTPVLHHSGRVTRADEVRVGDHLMGPDSQPRVVRSTTRGVGPRYRITPNKGEPWECNDVHVLTLRHTTTGEIVDIPLSEYLSKSKNYQHLHKQFGTGVDFPKQDALPIDPYFLGLWIGDGRKSLNTVAITKEDPEIVEHLQVVADQWGCSLKGEDSNGTRCTTWRLTTARGQPNLLLDTMRLLFPDGPHQTILTASREERLAVLAGIVDTDGTLGIGYFSVSQKRGPYSDAIAYLARSLGFRVTRGSQTVNGVVYDRWNILGDVDTIPTRIPRKQARPRQTNRNAQNTGFSVEKVSDAAPYFGFTLNGDGRFLLGDFQVTHNTEIAVGIMKAVPKLRWLFLAPEADLMHNAARRWTARTGEPAGMCGDGNWATNDERVVSATFQTIAYRLKDPSKRDATHAFLATFEGVIIDEVHQLPADDFYQVTLSLPNAYYRVGMSGTALNRGDKRNMYILAAVGEVIYRVPPTELMAAGWISRPTIRFVPVTQDGPKSKTYIHAYKDKIVRSKARNDVLVRLAEQAKKPALLFVKFEEHGQLLLAELRKRAKVRVEFMHGKHSIKQRDAMLDRVRWGDLDVIIATKVLQTGTDVPELASLVIGTGGASNIEAVQRVGRGMRVIKDDAGNMIKDTVDVWEVYDLDAKVLNAATGRKRKTRMAWFQDHSKERMRSYEAEGYPTIRLSAVESVRYGSIG